MVPRWWWCGRTLSILWLGRGSLKTASPHDSKCGGPHSNIITLIAKQEYDLNLMVKARNCWVCCCLQPIQVVRQDTIIRHATPQTLVHYITMGVSARLAQSLASETVQWGSNSSGINPPTQARVFSRELERKSVYTSHASVWERTRAEGRQHKNAALWRRQT